MSREPLGRRGERLAEKFLRGKGYVILAENYRCRFGEIDLIARDGETVVFVEVKGKSTARFGSPIEAVTRAKQERLARVALHYLAVCRLLRARTRFDVVGIRWRAGAGPEFILVRDAFRLDH